MQLPDRGLANILPLATVRRCGLDEDVIGAVEVAITLEAALGAGAALETGAALDAGVDAGTGADMGSDFGEMRAVGTGLITSRAAVAATLDMWVALEMKLVKLDMKRFTVDVGVVAVGSVDETISVIGAVVVAVISAVIAVEQHIQGWKGHVVQLPNPDDCANDDEVSKIG